MNLGTHDDWSPQLNVIHLLFQMFCDAELFKKILGETDKNQINLS